MVMDPESEVPPAYLHALREELVLASDLANQPLFLDSPALLDAASTLTSPWWASALDAHYQRAVVWRIAGILQRHAASSSVLIDASRHVSQVRASSDAELWKHMTVKRAWVQSAQFPDAMRQAAADALWLAGMSNERFWHRRLDLAMVYDVLMLTGAYAFLEPGLINEASTDVVREAYRILGYAAMTGGRIQ